MRVERLFYQIPLRLRSLLRRKHVEKELDEELQFHMDRKIEEAIAQGSTPREAGYAARRAMQGLEQQKEECRDMRRVAGIENLMQDFRFGVRILVSARSFTAAAVVTLALGIGANTAIYSVVKTVLLQPLPYPDPDHLVQLMLRSPEWAPGENVSDINEPEFIIWRGEHNSFKEVAAYDATGSGLNLGGNDLPEQITGLHVSADYFPLFGAPIEMGRTFSLKEDSPGGPRVVVISDGLWRRRFGGDPRIVGKTLVLKGEPWVVIGVVGASFSPDVASELWLPLQADANGTNNAHALRALARLQPGVTLEMAREQMKPGNEQYLRKFPKLYLHGHQEGFTAELLGDVIIGNVRIALLIAVGAVSLVLLIACANVANLLLVRATGRRREFAIRAALGGSRPRIVLQLLVEYVVLAFAGGMAGLPLGYIGLRTLIAASPGNIPRLGPNGSAITLDWQVFAFALIISVFTGVLFGLLPALQASRTELATRLSESSTRTSPGASQRRSRSILVIVEMALALVLLAGATLLIRTLGALAAVDPGFDAQNVLTMEMSLNGSPFHNAAAVAELVRAAERRVESLPGVTALAAAYSLPFKEQFGGPFVVEGHPDGSFGAAESFVSPRYFDVFRIPLRRGRTFMERDAAQAPPVSLINDSMARGVSGGFHWSAPLIWRGGDPLGERITLFKDMGPPLEDRTRQIIGVVGDVRDVALNREPRAIVYIPMAQLTDSFSELLRGRAQLVWAIRTKAAPSSMGAAIEREIRTASGGLPIAHVRPMTQLQTGTIARQQFNMTLLSIFAAIAVLLAGTGIYSVMAYAVEERTKEIGIRLALGAPTRQVLKTLVSEGMRLALVGVAIGILGSIGLMRFMRTLLFEVEPSDPVTLVMTSAFLSAIALIATYIPSRRATRIDPLQALRWE